MQGKCSRTISLNTHVYVLFHNFRDGSSISTLGRQMYPGNSNVLTEAYKNATSKKYAYLLVDMSPHSPDDLRLRSNIFPGECTHIYLPQTE